jgi:UPF0176 protein
MSDEIILNVAGYQFVSFEMENLLLWRQMLKREAIARHLKGTILLSLEGINLSLSGLPEAVENFMLFLQQTTGVNSIALQKTWSAVQPFRRLLVRIKKEIISMGKIEVSPEKNPVPYIDPKTLDRWMAENKDFVILDTRNRYEVDLGTFDKALDLQMDHFRHFPAAIQQLPEELKEKTIVTFCTGGIRCEKAALWMLRAGYKKVYQLQGGILNYFNACGASHFQGSCFVFDERSSIQPEKSGIKS